MRKRRKQEAKTQRASLSHLRGRLALLSVLITSAILAGMALAAAGISERQMQKAAESAFDSSFRSILYKIQADQRISHTWLAKTEVSSQLVIGILDGGTSLDFHGAWQPLTSRGTLLEQAREKALQLGLDVRSPPVSSLSTKSVSFPLYGDQGERYLGICAVYTVSSSPYLTTNMNSKRWQSLTLLRDVSQEDQAVTRQRMLFTGLALLGALLLLCFSWWFSGAALRPIEKNSREQTEFVAVASHELRSPLAVISASLEAMGTLPERAEPFRDTVLRECGRMNRLVDDLLILAGSDAKRLTVHFSSVEADTLLLNLTDDFLPLARKKNQKLSLSLPDGSLPTVQGDAQRLMQIVSILLDNAVHYVQEGGEIQVSAFSSHNGKRVVLEVADNGPGIPQEKRKYAFQRFYRGDSAHTDKEHFGLGLSIALELTRLHGGKLTLSDPKGHSGCVFQVELKAGTQENK